LRELWPASARHELCDIRRLLSLRPILRSPVALAIWLVLLGASAEGAVLETSPLDPEYPDAEPLGFVSYTGTGEERNRLHVTRGSRGRLLFVDRGARRLVLKGPGCFHLSRRRALCRPAEDASA